MAKRKYIVAGTMAQANAWVSEQKPEPGIRYYYVSAPHIIQGCVFPPGDVIYTGTYWEHPQFSAITRELNHVHAKARELNGL